MTCHQRRLHRLCPAAMFSMSYINSGKQVLGLSAVIQHLHMHLQVSNTVQSVTSTGLHDPLQANRRCGQTRRTEEEHHAAALAAPRRRRNGCSRCSHWNVRWNVEGRLRTATVSGVCGRLVKRMWNVPATCACMCVRPASDPTACRSRSVNHAGVALCCEGQQPDELPAQQAAGRPPAESSAE